ncbi:hypothetical protein [Actinoplanes derwentensis]|uniref:Septum formation initiator n=1 Tax=Actinoplanes derwentensis TaxID=113562 RepID=A0A1H2BGE8_9ACTN|nr:hypothetical protein [Actinoplanes derwentensis]GID87777.1 hypothetical protein Ade03nite_67010 [Actinoplanes derwentensis]SDT56969.1 hypothetical protein SAMN04489716_4573 [Actinoplanes derwentensis]
MRLIDRLGRLPLVIVFGWVVAAALAVLVGVVGIGLVGSGLFSQETEPLSETDVARALQAEETTATPGESTGEIIATPSPSRASEKPTGSHSFPTRGGTVIADCDHIISMSPAQGFAVHEQGDDEGEFRNVRDGHFRVKVDLGDCAGGIPNLEVSVETDDD